ncbi:MAG: hypothetical protein JW913_08450 [Chitinispirillaceae bacterium]|nr:hypothetical protein [Chitinispirillaceae bacterium]
MMMRPLFLRVAAVMLLAASCFPPLRAELSSFPALERKRFGNSSFLSINAHPGDGWNLYGSDAIAVPLGKYLLSAAGSWKSGGQGRSSLDPSYLFLTREVKRTVISAGAGYGFDEEKTSSSGARVTCTGPEIEPFECLDTVSEREFMVRWRRNQSFFAAMQGLVFLSSRNALLAGLEVSFTPQRGFSYEEEYIDDYQRLLLRYHRYDEGAWGAGVAAAAGLWREAVRFRRRWSTLLLARWNSNYKKSEPVVDSVITAYGYSGPDTTIQYAGEKSPSHLIRLEYAAAEFNPDRLFLSWVQDPLLSEPLLVVNQLKLFVSHSSTHSVSTYVNRWTRGGRHEYGTTSRTSRTILGSAGGQIDLTGYFLRRFYVGASGRLAADWTNDDRNLTYSADAWGGVRVSFRKKLIVDLGCTALGISGENGYYPDMVRDAFAVRLALSLVDRSR